MANISITVAQLTVSREVTDANATKLLDWLFKAYVRRKKALEPAYEEPTTARNKLQFTLNGIVGDMVHGARMEVRATREQEIRDAIEAEQGEIVANGLQ